MTSGVYIRTKKVRKNISKSAKKSINIGRFVKGHKHSKQTKIKIGLKSKGRIPWNKGLTKETDKRLKPIFGSFKKGIYQGYGFKKEHTPWNKGIPWSKEMRKILGLGRKGKVHSEETKKRMSESRRGEKSPSWRGGLTKNPYSIEWTKELRQKIKERDNYTCQKCGIKIVGPRMIKKNPSKNWLTIHHIDYDKQNCKSNNLITLCHYCNVLVNTKRKYWTKYFQGKIEMTG